MCQPCVPFHSIYFIIFIRKHHIAWCLWREILCPQLSNGMDQILLDRNWCTLLCRSSEIRSRATETGPAGKRNAPSFKIEVGAATTYSVRPRMWRSRATVDNYCFCIRNVFNLILKPFTALGTENWAHLPSLLSAACLMIVPDKSGPVYCWTTAPHMHNRNLILLFPKGPKTGKSMQTFVQQREVLFSSTPIQKHSGIPGPQPQKQQLPSNTHWEDVISFWPASQAISSLIMGNRFVAVYPNHQAEGKQAGITSRIPDNSISLTKVRQVTV